MSHLRTADSPLLKRKCVACGYDGALLRNGHADRCARCGIDLRHRPARSYAEMEGLLGQPEQIDAPGRQQAREERLIHRWLTFLFFVLLGFIAAAYLTLETLSFTS